MPPVRRARGSITALEIWQASFDVPARVVTNVGDDMMLGVENGAPCDGGRTVSFIACPFMADYRSRAKASLRRARSRYSDGALNFWLNRSNVSIVVHRGMKSRALHDACGPTARDLRAAAMAQTLVSNSV
jgi:hypothetical protein